MSVGFTAYVLERHITDLECHLSRACVQRLQAGVFHLVVTAHLLHEEQRIGAYVHAPTSMSASPLERGEQPVVFGDVVGRQADGAAELFNQLAIGPLDANAETRRSWIAARAPIDVRDHSIALDFFAIAL